MRILLPLLLFIPSIALAQPAPPTGPQQLASFLASSLAAALAENDQLRTQVADLTKQRDATKATPKPTEAK